MDFIALAHQCAPLIDPQIIQQIVMVESKFNPYAININAKAKLSRQPNNITEAVLTAKNLVQLGYNIDVGFAQINYTNFDFVGLILEDAFNPCKNLQAAEKILLYNYRLAFSKYHDVNAAIYAAVSAYNTGSFSKGFQNGYVQKIFLRGNAL